MILELFSHFASLDFAWVAGLILNNLHWVFLLAVYVFIAHEGKKVFWNFIFLVGALYIALDLLPGIWGINFFHAGLWLFIAIPLEFFIIGTIFDRHKDFTIWFTFIVVSFICTFFLVG